MKKVKRHQPQGLEIEESEFLHLNFNSKLSLSFRTLGKVLNLFRKEKNMSTHTYIFVGAICGRGVFTYGCMLMWKPEVSFLTLFI